MTEFKSYPLFTDITNVHLQAFNRCATFFNIIQDVGLAEAQDYARQFDELARRRMYKMLEDIRDRGYNMVKQEVISSLTVHWYENDEGIY